MSPEELYHKYKGRSAVRIRLPGDNRCPNKGKVVGYCTAPSPLPLIIAVTDKKNMGWKLISFLFDHIMLCEHNQYGYRYINESMIVKSIKFGRKWKQF